MTAIREVLPGVLRIRLPLPFELSAVNVYLVPLAEGYLLIDCGMQSAGSFEILSGALAEAGIPWNAIKRILLTHMHPDHMGLSGRLLELTGAHLSMHRDELRQLEAVLSPERRAAWIGRALAEAAVPLELQATIDDHYQVIRPNFFPLAPDCQLTGGETIPTAIGPLTVLWTPGHSPGHICLYSEPHRLLFAGDQILPTITPNISWQPGADTLADYLGSLEALKPLAVDLILPAHGDPFTGHCEWIAQTTLHHAERCAELRAALGRGPRTVFSLVGELWRKRLSPVNQQFAVLEIMAHLEYMRRREQARGEPQGAAVHWSA